MNGVRSESLEGGDGGGVPGAEAVVGPESVADRVLASVPLWNGLAAGYDLLGFDQASGRREEFRAQSGRGLRAAHPAGAGLTATARVSLLRLDTSVAHPGHSPGCWSLAGSACAT